MKIVDYGHVAEYGRKDRLFSLTGIRQMNAPIRQLSSSIVQESAEKCEVVHNIGKSFPRIPGQSSAIVWFLVDPCISHADAG
jgi:hypothetical protein